ncbi:hypothetical protein [Streptomyces sp. NPDC004232]|uniref:hypothetical protein n=1 Tax=unclassified Streptomyces TaxID=2593676 RepID=UPI001D26DB32|nr:hypothetical protein [Streptomyces sp. tea 10]
MRTVLAAVVLAAAAAFGGATPAAAHSGSAPSTTDDASGFPLLETPVSLICHVDDVLGNAPACD